MTYRRLTLCVLSTVLALTACRGGMHNGLLPTTTPERRGAHTLAAGDAYSTAVLADAPTAYYHLNDTGSAAADSSGNGIAGSIGSSVTKGVPGLIRSNSDTAMTFPGSNTTAGVIRTAQSTLLQPSSSVSLECWLSFTAMPPTFTVPVAYGSDSAFAPYDLYFNGGKITAQFDLTTGVLVVTSPSILQPNMSLSYRLNVRWSHRASLCERRAGSKRCKERIAHRLPCGIWFGDRR